MGDRQGGACQGEGGRRERRGGEPGDPGRRVLVPPEAVGHRPGQQGRGQRRGEEELARIPKRTEQPRRIEEPAGRQVTAERKDDGAEQDGGEQPPDPARKRTGAPREAGAESQREDGRSEIEGEQDREAHVFDGGSPVVALAQRRGLAEKPRHRELRQPARIDRPVPALRGRQPGSAPGVADELGHRQQRHRGNPGDRRGERQGEREAPAGRAGARGVVREDETPGGNERERKGELLGGAGEDRKGAGGRREHEPEPASVAQEEVPEEQQERRVRHREQTAEEISEGEGDPADREDDAGQRARRRSHAEDAGEGVGGRRRQREVQRDLDVGGQDRRHQEREERRRVEKQVLNVSEERLAAVDEPIPERQRSRPHEVRQSRALREDPEVEVAKEIRPAEGDRPGEDGRHARREKPERALANGPGRHRGPGRRTHAGRSAFPRPRAARTPRTNRSNRTAA